MKCVALLDVDLETAPIGLPSRLADEIAGVPVLRRTVERLARARRLDAIIVVAPPAQQPRVAALLDGTPARIEPAGDAPAFRPLVRAGRVWGLDAWRGGVGGLCAFDEEVRPLDGLRIVQCEKADYAAFVHAAAALVDPALVDDMLGHAATHESDLAMIFAQSPPGLTPVLLSRRLLESLGPTGQPPGGILRYHPDRPQADLTGKPTCFRPHSDVIEARGRLVADTHRSSRRVADLVAAGADEWPAEKIAAALKLRRFDNPGLLPEEVEIELTTDDPTAGHAGLRPRAPLVPRRGPISIETVERIAAELRPEDDVRVVLGGFGEPALHPRFADAVGVLRRSRALAVGVRTSALAEDDTLDRVLFDTPVDVVIVTLDAATPETYRRVHGTDGFERVTARLLSWAERRVACRQVCPLIVPEFVKTADNYADLEAFYDEWMRRLGTAVIAGPSDFAGRLPDRAVTDATPPRRVPCRQLFRRAMVLADGTLATCDQDFAGTQPVGRIDAAGLRELWTGRELTALRGAHRVAAELEDAQTAQGSAAARRDSRTGSSATLARWPLCPKCRAWHRP